MSRDNLFVAFFFAVFFFLIYQFYLFLSPFAAPLFLAGVKESSKKGPGGEDDCTRFDSSPSPKGHSGGTPALHKEPVDLRLNQSDAA